MLTNDDIKRLTDAQIEAQKEVFYSKEDLDKKFNALQTSVDSFAKEKKDNNEEILVLNNNVKDLQDWAEKVSPQVGIKFER